MFSVLLPCLPCLTKHAKQEMSGNDRKKRKIDNQPNDTASAEPLKADDVQGLAGIRTRMQKMGHFLNEAATPATSTCPKINLDNKTMDITAELISVVPREPRNCGGKIVSASSILDRQPNPNRIPDRNFVTCKAHEEPSIGVEWDQFKKNIECNATHTDDVISISREEYSRYLTALSQEYESRAAQNRRELNEAIAKIQHECKIYSPCDSRIKSAPDFHSTDGFEPAGESGNPSTLKTYLEIAEKTLMAQSGDHESVARLREECHELRLQSAQYVTRIQALEDENRCFAKQLNHAKRVITEAKGVMFGEIMEAKRQLDQSKQGECVPLAAEGRKARRFSQLDNGKQHEPNEEIGKLRAVVRALEHELSQKEMAASLGEMQRSSLAASMEEVTMKLEESMLALQAANARTGKELRKAQAASLQLRPGAREALLACTKELSGYVAKEGKRLRRVGALEREVARLREGLRGKEEEVARLRLVWQLLLVSHPDLDRAGEAATEQLRDLRRQLAEEQASNSALLVTIAYQHLRLMLARWRRPGYARRVAYNILAAAAPSPPASTAAHANGA